MKRIAPTENDSANGPLEKTLRCAVRTLDTLQPTTKVIREIVGKMRAKQLGRTGVRHLMLQPPVLEHIGFTTKEKYVNA